MDASQDTTCNRKPRGRHPHRRLSHQFVRTVTEPGRYCDGDGLYLRVEPTGSRHWIQRLVIHRRRRELGLGGFPLVSLAQAREQAFDNRRVARAGGDPRAGLVRQAPAFAVAAMRVWEQRRDGWRNGKYARDWPSSLQRYAFPRIGEQPVSEVTSADVLDILGPIWHAKPETARRVLQRLDAVMEWSVTMQFRNDNPCARVRATLGRQRNVVRHMPALPYREVAAAIATVHASRSIPAVKLAFEFLVLTAARSGEVRLATRDEIDLEAAVWTVPGTRMKSGREHQVPLSGRAVEILHAVRDLRNATSPLVFPSARGRSMADFTLSRLLKVERIAAVPHGFRSSFRDWAAEQTDHPREVIEAALAHTVPNKVEAAYARSTLLDRRRALMRDWAAFLGRG